MYVPKIEEEKKEDAVYGINNRQIKIRQPDVPYSQCLGISYDDNLFMWKAEHGNKELGLYQSSKEAFEAREIYIASLPMPKLVDGDYSKARGISFSKMQKLWTMSVKGRIISYHSTENEAIRARKIYLREKGLVDVKVKGGYKTITTEERDRLKAKLKEKKEKESNSKSKSKPIKTIDSNSNIKNEINKARDSINSSINFTMRYKDDSDKKPNKLDYAKEFESENKSKGKAKVKVKNGNKVKLEKSNKKVKINGGNRVSKNKSNKDEKSKKHQVSINKKESSKYEGVFYEDGLFMWSAEVEGKHLGLFSSEEEAHEKRNEYIKNKSSI